MFFEWSHRMGSPPGFLLKRAVKGKRRRWRRFLHIDTFIKS
jgi:hypothetical protein